MTASPEDILIERHNVALLYKYLDELEPGHRAAIAGRFGLEGNEQTWDALGEPEGVWGETIRQRAHKGMRLLLQKYLARGDIPQSCARCYAVIRRKREAERARDAVVAARYAAEREEQQRIQREIWDRAEKEAWAKREAWEAEQRQLAAERARLEAEQWEMQKEIRRRRAARRWIELRLNEERGTFEARWVDWHWKNYD